jgi:hypothetical protein
VARGHGTHAIPSPQVIRNIKALKLKRSAEYQSKKPSSNSKLTRIPSDSLINTKKKTSVKKEEKKILNWK